jgi:hypothetical protein
VRSLRGSGGQRDSSEREREVVGVLTNGATWGEAVEMATQRCSTEVIDGALMGRWFRTRGGDIGAGVSAVDNGGALIAPFIGS